MRKKIWKTDRELLILKKLWGHFDPCANISHSFQLCWRVQISNSNVDVIYLTWIFRLLDFQFLIKWQCWQHANITSWYRMVGYSHPYPCCPFTVYWRKLIVKPQFTLISNCVIFLIFRWCSTIGKKCYILSSLCHLD